MVVDKSYNLALLSISAGLFCSAVSLKFDNKFGGILSRVSGGAAVQLLAISTFIGYQAATLSFQFDADSFIVSKANDAISASSSISRWDFNKITSYGFVPSETFPLLVYFKETQMPSESWAELPIIVDDKPGQAHLYPAVVNSQQLMSQWKSKIKH
jgi:hypothetical protein